MRRIARYALNALTALSLLLCGVLVYQWFCSQLGERVWVRVVNHRMIVYGADGVEAQSAEEQLFDPARAPRSHQYEGPTALVRALQADVLGSRVWSVAGVQYHRDPSVPVSTFRVLIVPVVYLVALTAALPAVWVVRVRGARRRAARGQCRHCGYDLRATPDRCPECGAVGAGATPRG